jgi:hypothetical protein
MHETTTSFVPRSDFHRDTLETLGNSSYSSLKERIAVK